jgi:hypothetical protein
MPADAFHSKALETLLLLDPALAAAAQNHLDRLDASTRAAAADLMVDDTLWGLEREISFGQAISAGYLDLLTQVDLGVLRDYHRLVRTAGGRGPTIGRLMALHLVPVLKSGNRALRVLFTEAACAMESKGTYTLKPPLEALTELITTGDQSAAEAFLKLMAVSFGKNLTYNQCQRLSVDLPQAALSFAPTRRVWQLEQLCRVVQADVRLVDAFLAGMRKGLQLLSAAALERFVSAALDHSGPSFPQAAAAFLSVDSRLGSDLLAELRVAVRLPEVEPQLNHYLAARSGLRISVRPLSDLTGRQRPASPDTITARTDGRYIYLPEEIAFFEQQKDNRDLYRCLARFESGLCEFGTFDFDLERLRDRCRTGSDCRAALDGLGMAIDAFQPSSAAADIAQFCNLFALPPLAADLFTIFEHGRIRIMLARCYPGLIRTFLPILQSQVGLSLYVMDELYAAIALGLPPDRSSASNIGRSELVERLLAQFVRKTAAEICRAEASGELVVMAYDRVAETLSRQTRSRLTTDAYRRLQPPFDRRVDPHLRHPVLRAADHKALALKEHLAQKGLRIYRAELRTLFETPSAAVGEERLAAILENAAAAGGRAPGSRLPTVEEFAAVLADELSEALERLPTVESESPAQAVAWYREWDCRLGDYLNQHTRVRDRAITGGGSRFYRRTLARRRGLVKRIRTAFELLRPDGLKLCRRWIEGDAFDYRALIDFVLDRKAGRAPSERLYTQRLKVNRDVAVLLLVDLSRSTANPVAGSTQRVLDVAKEAIVLFSEALDVVGDLYAIAGFSGNGRLGVDYFRVKDFGESMSAMVRKRIAAMAPHRNTRMGAAIRHASAQFSAVSSRVRLLILLGDGFPNDLDYKKHYAIEDTRRAISEQRSRHIHVHAITIDIKNADDARLDDLYGEIHHNVVTDVAELPDKLWRIYGMLTR